MTDLNYEFVIIETIKNYLSNSKKDIEINLDSSIVEIGIDSLDIIEIALSIEEKYKINVPVDNLLGASVNSIRDLILFIKENNNA
jgi:acyl carrier protein